MAGNVGVRELLESVYSFLQGIHAHCKPPHDRLDSLVETQVKVLLAEALEKETGGEKGHAGRISRHEMAAIAAGWALYGLALLIVKRGEGQPLDPLIDRAVVILKGILYSPIATFKM